MGLSQVSFFLLVALALFNGGSCTTFTIVNQCGYTVWPGILSGAGTVPLPTTGFVLNPSETRVIPIPVAWSGRIWGRTLCSQNGDSTGIGKFTCVTGDCGSSSEECSGSGAAPPATLAEFTLNGAGGLDFYDVSLVDGYNIPMTIVPQGGVAGAGNCTATGCVAELNDPCPADLKVSAGSPEMEAEGTVACKSACEAFGEPQYCCSGAYGTPETCKPSEYSEFFKNACPKAYSYAYDDGSSTFTCSGADYLITFCPSPSPSMKSASMGLQPEAVSVSVASSRIAAAFSFSVFIAAGWVVCRIG